MALLTIPSEPIKGEELSFALDVSDLSALIPQSYYAAQNNWSKVLVLYKAYFGNQLIGLSFYPNNTDSIPATTTVAENARSLFRVNSIIVYDKQNGYYILESSDIPGVDAYNIVFPSSGAAFFPFSGSQTYEKMGQDEDYLYTTSDDVISYDSIAMFHAPFTDDTGVIVNALQNIVNQFETLTYKFSADMTKMYAIGRYGTTFAGKALPPVTTGPNYTANPPRFIEVDVGTKNVTWLCDIQDTAIPNTVNDFFIDFNHNIAVFFFVNGASAIASYNLANNTRLWQNATNNESWLKGFDIYPDHFLTYVATYPGTSYSQRTLTKIHKLTGAVASIATQPNAPVGAFFSTPAWDMTPDRAKAYISYYDGSNYAAIYDVASDTWQGNATISLSEGGNSMSQMTITEDFVFFQKGTSSPYLIKYDLALVKDPSFPGHASQMSSPIFADDENIYFRSNTSYVKKANVLTGVIDTSYLGFVGAGAEMCQLIDGKLMVRSLAYFGVINCLYTNPPAANTKAQVLAKVDKATREIVNLIQPGIDFFRSDYNEVGLLTSPIINGKVLSQSLSGQFLCYNTVTQAADSGWPLFNAFADGVNALVDGDWVYFAIPGTPATTMNVTDGSGTFAMTTLLARFSLSTKLVDQSFEPVFASNLNTGRISISTTDEYIYLSTTGSPSLIARVKKSDQSVQYITAGDLGLTGTLRGRFRFYQYDTNKISLVLDRVPGAGGGGSGPAFVLAGNKPYMNYVESTLALDPVQPTGMALFSEAVFNPTNKEFAGRMQTYTGVSWSTEYLAYYGIPTNTQNLVQDVSSPTLTTGNSFPLLWPNQNPTLRYMQPDGAGYMVYIFGTVMLDYQLYNGVMRMEPFGISNNGDT